jgi:hypothetical protein
MVVATTMVTGVIALALVWVTAGLVSRLIDRSIDRALPDPRWFEA